MTATLITLAADHASHLLVQGKTPDEALEHARLRFGVTADQIKAEIESRHNFALAVSPADVPEPLPAELVRPASASSEKEERDDRC